MELEEIKEKKKWGGARFSFGVILIRIKSEEELTEI